MDLVFAAVLRRVHRGVGVAEEGRGIAAVAWIKGEANTGGDEELKAFDGRCFADGGQETARSLGSILDFLEAGEDRREFIATHARQDIVACHAGFKTSGDLLKKTISDG